MNSKALTKIQSILLGAIIVAAAGAGAAHVLLDGQEPSSETIKIGYIGEIVDPGGPGVYGLRGVEWAVEQINAEGGVLGKLLEVVAENSGGDVSDTQLAAKKLITLREVDFIIGILSDDHAYMCQDVCAEYKKIYINANRFVTDTGLTQRVADDYEKYKYFFRYGINQTVENQVLIESLVTLKEYSGFNKIALLSDHYPDTKADMSILEAALPAHGFEIVYANSIAAGTATGGTTPYLVAIEESGAEILVPIIGVLQGIELVKEWHDRQSPLVVWGVCGWLSGLEGWDVTRGKCEYTTFGGNSFSRGYAVSNKTLPVRDAYIDKYAEKPTGPVGDTYDAVRFVLYSALERAGTTETEAVIKALEETSIETCMYPLFAFTSSHDGLVREEDYNSRIKMYFQWQNGTLVPVYPTEVMEEAGATYLFPDWEGPWD